MLKHFFWAMCLFFNSNLYSMEKVEQALLQSKSVEQVESFSRFIFEFEIKSDLFQSIYDATKNIELAQYLSDSFQSEFTSAKGLKLPVQMYIEAEGISDSSDADKMVSFKKVINVKLVVGKAAIEKRLQVNMEDFKEELVAKALVDNNRDLVYPVKHKRISSPFLLARRHPVKRGRVQPHRGVDFTAPAGTPVYPAKDGVIVAMGRTKAKGKYILIEHNDGKKTTYDHLKKFQKGLRLFDSVTIDDQIGEVGRTGFTTGAHLHFGLIDEEGYYIDPTHYFAETPALETIDPDLQAIELETEE